MRHLSCFPIAFLLVFLALFVPADSQASAVNPVSSRWQVISSQDGITISFDTATIQFADRQETKIRFWQKCSFDAAAATELSAQLTDSATARSIAYFLEDRTFDIVHRTKTMHELNAYDAHHLLLETNRPDAQRWDSIPPDSASDTICLAIIDYAQKHKQQLIENSSIGKGGTSHE